VLSAPIKGEKMLARLRFWFALGLTAALGDAVLAVAPAAVAGGDDEELVDVSKTVADIEKKMGELRERGRWAKRGKLSLAAVCGEERTERVFLPWLDPAEYTLAPQGDFESGSEWTLKKDAAVMEGNSPFSGGQRSLFLPDHGEAISPVICVSVAHPTIRLFARNGGSSESKLEIELIYEDTSGKVRKLKIAKLRGSDAWNPSIVIPIYVNVIAAAVEDGITAVAFKFKAKDVNAKGGGWQLDDFYVDPFKSR
jgi:hypothetical protein